MPAGGFWPACSPARSTSTRWITRFATAFTPPCAPAAGEGLAVTDKGKTATELIVFARYVMFSEVYWHHGVRSATAMLQRAFYLLHDQLDLDGLFRMTEQEMIDE